MSFEKRNSKYKENKQRKKWREREREKDIICAYTYYESAVLLIRISASLSFTISDLYLEFK